MSPHTEYTFHRQQSTDIATMVESAYNKFSKNGHGTLVGNWQEERELRDFTGEGR